MTGSWRITHDMQHLEQRWLQAHYDASALQEAQAHRGGCAMPKSPAALEIGLKPVSRDDALSLFIEIGWIGRG